LLQKKVLYKKSIKKDEHRFCTKINSKFKLIFKRLNIYIKKDMKLYNYFLYIWNYIIWYWSTIPDNILDYGVFTWKIAGLVKFNEFNWYILHIGKAIYACIYDARILYLKKNIGIGHVLILILNIYSYFNLCPYKYILIYAYTSYRISVPYSHT
jgi:hypothetical protein